MGGELPTHSQLNELESLAGTKHKQRYVELLLRLAPSLIRAARELEGVRVELERCRSGRASITKLLEKQNARIAALEAELGSRDGG
jgi:hypothetical protein